MSSNQAGGIALSSTPVGVNPYWYSFPGFVPNPLASVSKEFNRLARHMGWARRERNRRKYEAYESEFNFFFVDKGSKLATWQRLCEEVGIGPPPPSIVQCKKALKSVLVNLDNLLHVRRNPSVRLIKFANYHHFHNYTSNGHYVPREGAKSEGFVSVFLRQIASN